MKYILSLIFAMIMMASCSKTDSASVDVENLIQIQALPKVYVRLTNPTQANGITSYDVEFKADQPGLRHTGMNVRIWLQASNLGWVGMSEFANGYAASPPNPAQVSTGTAASGPAIFGFPGAARYVNGAMQLVNRNAPPIFLNDWVKLFKVNFSGTPACPVVILDKERIYANGGFYINDGITISCDKLDNKDFGVDEVVTEYIGWQQTQDKMPFGMLIPCGN